MKRLNGSGEAGLVAQRTATLASLRKVNDFPFYTMTYHGGYNFDQYLKTGVGSGPEDYRMRRMLTGADQVLDRGGLEQCSCFTARSPKGEILFGRNFDLPGEHGVMLLHTAPPGAYASASLVELEALGYKMSPVLAPDPFDAPKDLLAAPYVPRDGMNEHGVAVSTLSVPPPEHYERQGKTCIGRWAPVRLVLDYARNVDEAVELLSNYSIIIGAIGVHYFIADKSGKTAIVEYWDGGMKVISGDRSWQAVTNFIMSSPGQEGSGHDRYERACNVLEASNGMLDEREAVELLNKVAKYNTIWSALYNLNSAKLQLVLGRRFDDVLTFDLEI